MRPTLAAIIGLALATAPCLAEPARILHVTDGDTVWVDMAAGNVKVRVASIDTPEVGDKAKCDAERAKGDAASAFAKRLMPAGKAVDVQPTGRREKWNRLLAHIFVDGRNYASLVIARGLGVYYSGRTKPDWCSSR